MLITSIMHRKYVYTFADIQVATFILVSYIIKRQRAVFVLIWQICAFLCRMHQPNDRKRAQKSTTYCF